MDRRISSSQCRIRISDRTDTDRASYHSHPFSLEIAILYEDVSNALFRYVYDERAFNGT